MPGKLEIEDIVTLMPRTFPVVSVDQSTGVTDIAAVAFVIWAIHAKVAATSMVCSSEAEELLWKVILCWLVFITFDLLAIVGA
jgi:hypothetical protein